jgi:hypothetical protein
MTHRLLAVDCLLSAVPLVVPGVHDQGNLLGIFVKTAERTVDGLRRYYYAGLGAHRILLVMRNGHPLESISQPDAYIKALVGWDAGTSEFVLPAHAGKRHTKITVDMLLTLDERAAQKYAAAAGVEIESLAHVLAQAPRSDRAGGARGDVGRKPVGGDVEAVARTITLLPEQWEIIERLGGSNRSAGARRMVQEWQRTNGGDDASD